MVLWWFSWLFSQKQYLPWRYVPNCWHPLVSFLASRRSEEITVQKCVSMLKSIYVVRAELVVLTGVTSCCSSAVVWSKSSGKIINIRLTKHLYHFLTPSSGPVTFRPLVLMFFGVSFSHVLLLLPTFFLSSVSPRHGSSFFLVPFSSYFPYFL